MNRLIYLIPLASFPLLAIAEQGPDSSTKTDNKRRAGRAEYDPDRD